MLRYTLNAFFIPIENAKNTENKNTSASYRNDFYEDSIEEKHQLNIDAQFTSTTLELRAVL
jgi:hypothetical protein